MTVLDLLPLLNGWRYIPFDIIAPIVCTAILALLGIVMVLVSVYGVISAIPGWAWALLAVGGVIILLGPTIAKAVTAGYERYEVVRA